MDSAQAARTVLVCGTLEAVYVLIRGYRSPGADTYKGLWSIGALTLGLAVAADFAPEVAGPFAILVLVAMVARNSGEFGQVLGTNAAARTAGVPRNVAPTGPVGPVGAGGVTTPAGNRRYSDSSAASSRPG